jgi:uncharacterized protein YodC (DUF2158 family)
MQPKFKIGDIVKLKSGSPDMTITQVYKLAFENDKFSGHYKCQYYNETTKTFSSSDFHEDALEEVKAK